VSQGNGPDSEPRPASWREAIRAEEQKRRRRPADQRATLRRLTASAAVAAASLNAILFVQTGIEQSGPGDFQNAIIAAIGGMFPRAGLQPAFQTPTPATGATPVATTGGS
jgi:hypothetical protein